MVGIAETDYVRGTDRHVCDLILDASMSAIRDAGLTPADVDGVILSPGPGDPARLETQVALARAIIDDGRPLLGICLGHQIVGRAAGAETRRLRFRHLGGATRGMDVTWHIEPTSTGCRVTIEHDFRPRVGAWARFVDRAFTRPIAGRTLRTFKALAETLAERAPGTGSGVMHR